MLRPVQRRCNLPCIPYARAISIYCEKISLSPYVLKCHAGSALSCLDPGKQFVQCSHTFVIASHATILRHAKNTIVE